MLSFLSGCESCGSCHSFGMVVEPQLELLLQVQPLSGPAEDPPGVGGVQVSNVMIVLYQSVDSS